jgi:Pvc16 N-terminal domain
LATYHAIAATGQAILGVLAGACPKPEFAGARFELYQSSDFQKPLEEGLSLYLYRVAINQARRGLPPRPAPDGRIYRAPLDLDLYYLLSAWAKSAVRQHHLLGWAMRALEDTPILLASILNQYGPDPEIFRATETVELIGEPLSLQDLTNIWSIIKLNPQTSVGYIARLVSIDSSLPVVEAKPIQILAYDLTKGPT